PPIEAGDRRAAQQQLGCLLVRLDQLLAGRSCGEGGHRLRDSVIVEPRSTVRAEVDATNRVAEPAHEEYLTKGLAFRRGCVPLAADEVSPLHRRELQHEWLLYLDQLAVNHTG